MSCDLYEEPTYDWQRDRDTTQACVRCQDGKHDLCWIVWSHVMKTVGQTPLQMIARQHACACHLDQHGTGQGTLL